MIIYAIFEHFTLLCYFIMFTDNLLHIVRSWFKRDLIIDTIDQLVSGTSAGGQMDVSDTCLMLLVLLRNSDRKWQKEEVTSVQSCQVDAFCGFWGCLLTQVELIRRTGSVDVPALKQVDYYYDTLTERYVFDSRLITICSYF